MTELSIKVYKTNNGYYAKGREVEFVIEDKKELETDFETEADSFARLAQELADYFGVFNSKHHSHRLEITVTKQTNDD